MKETAQTRILVVDDESAIVELLTSLLRSEGFAVSGHTDPAEALKTCEAQGFDLAIVDLMMPQMNGFELCTKMRAITRAPIVFLSAKDDESDQVAGLTLGADDYITKPFKPRELIARVKAHLRRVTYSSDPAQGSVLRRHDIEVDLRTHEARLLGIELALTPKEFAILALLMQRIGEPVSGEDIFQEVWHERFDSSGANSVMVHIRHLRAKLAEVDSSREFIQTVWGVGYKMVEQGRLADEMSADDGSGAR
ncbi:MAG: response regulator transcription factor [Eggerthellaceae bacterium]|nr:response regulator transcription factor [Eggerthellaceae bacterium]